MKTKLVFLLAMISNCLVFGQEKDTHDHEFRYWNSFATGILIGESEKTITGSFTTVHGMALNRWRFGIGVGVEGHENWRTMPVFLSGSFDFGRIRNNALYLQMNGGYSFAKYLTKIEGAANAEEDGGLMLNPMIGYRLNAGKVDVSFSAGYKLQRVDYSFDWIWGWPTSARVEEEFHRFMLQIGIGFN
jgi:hypothetical protein